MSVPRARELAASGRLYPSLILYGGNEAARRDAALDLARTLQCEAAAEERPCGVCRHCRRIRWPAGDEASYHPDFQVLERDLRASTSVDATRELLKTAQVAPFEARGQVFVVASAESLTGEAANALLKTLEEPHDRAPRHFFLLAPSHLDLLPTLRSRSLALYLGPAEPISDDETAPVAEAFSRAVAGFAETRASVFVLLAAEALAQVEGWGDPRSGRPWAAAAAAVLATVRQERVPPVLRRPLLALAEELLTAPALRLRGITEKRILEGLVARTLTSAGADLGPVRVSR